MQAGLFDDQSLQASIPGLRYEENFLSLTEEAHLIEVIQSLPFKSAKYKEYFAKRRVVGFGGSFDFEANQLKPGQPLDERLLPLRLRVAQWANMEPERLSHALVSEYSPGTPLGWHRDVPDFECIFGISFGGTATLKFRPYPYNPKRPHQTVSLVVNPRSIYVMRGDARWKWQHCVEETSEMRWSVTFRDLRRQATQVSKQVGLSRWLV